MARSIYLGLACMLVIACQKAPGTARDQLIYISEEKEIALGLSAFREVLKSAPLSKDPEVTLMVNRVGQRIAKAANKPEYVWEFVVIDDDDQINAFALPGGKVAIFSGILKYTQTEAEIGALAGAAAGGIDPGVAIGAMSAYGVGVALPNSRDQETEADFIGLQLMAKAGYDPHEAVPFWERMSGCPRKMIGKYCFRSQNAIPEFLSTHPSDVTRINQIEAWIPQAMRFYRPDPINSREQTSPIRLH